MTLRVVTFAIADLGESLNVVLRYEHFRLYMQLKQRIGKAMQVARVRKCPPFEHPVTMEFFPRLNPKRKKFDVTNYIVFTKLFEDWLVELEVLGGDTSDYVKRISINEPMFADSDHMIVEIRELDLPAIPRQVDLLAKGA